MAVGAMNDGMFKTLIENADGTVAQQTVEQGNLYARISTNATTTVKSGAGTLHAIIFNKVGASANTATVYDNTAGSGTIIALFDTTATGLLGSIIYDLKFTTGLTIVTATGTAADITVVYR